ncbi:MAG: VOC family protein [Saprospiraceae bacterium]|nr:VOC family protein [Saprospiraceae bacterium]
MEKIKTITPHLWYDTEARQAAEFYVSIFPGSKIKSVRTIDGTPSGKVDIVSFELCKQPFMAISAGPLFKFNESVSFMIHCDNQEEIDYYWHNLTEGGEEQPCGWLKDKFGLSWQIVPSEMDRMMETGTAKQVGRVTIAFLQMKKFDIDTLHKAFAIS